MRMGSTRGVHNEIGKYQITTQWEWKVPENYTMEMESTRELHNGGKEVPEEYTMGI